MCYLDFTLVSYSSSTKDFTQDVKDLDSKSPPIALQVPITHGNKSKVSQSTNHE
jgi:hypothetical protein